MLSLHQHLVNARMAIRRLEQKQETKELSYNTAMNRLSNGLKSLRIDHRQSDSLGQIIDDLRLQVGQLSIDISANTTSRKNKRLAQKQRAQERRVVELRREKREIIKLLNNTNKKVDRLELLLRSREDTYNAEAGDYENTIATLRCMVQDKDSEILLMQTEIDGRIHAVNTRAAELTRPFPHRLTVLSEYVSRLTFEPDSISDELRYIHFLYHTFTDKTRLGNAELFLREVNQDVWFCMEETCYNGVCACCYTTEPGTRGLYCLAHGKTDCQWGVIVMVGGVRKLRLSS
jgi:chromosome segregation ATPase